MPAENTNRNYERNRENKVRRRRFKGSNVESVHDGLLKTPANVRRSRIDLPTRSAKSLNNLSIIDKEPGSSDQSNGNANTNAAAMMPLTKILKWCKHISSTSATRDTPPQLTPGRVIPLDQQKASPPRYQQMGHPSKRRGFMGPLGLGEYVDSMGGGFDDNDYVNDSPQTQVKSRSLIDISMSNLWGDEEELNDEEDEPNNSEESGRESFEKSHKTSVVVSVSQKPNLLATIARFIQIPPSPPNLVQFMASPETASGIYESMETTFFGNSEDRWSLPAIVVTTCTQMQRGDLFNVHCVSDYMAELKLTVNWVKSVHYLCEGELRKCKSAGKGKRQKKPTFPGLNSSMNSGKMEFETELKDLCADFNAFLEAYDAFKKQMKEELRGGTASALLIAGHTERLTSLKSLLPVTTPYPFNENQKTPPYRKFLCETQATAVFSAVCRSQEAPVEISAFLQSDCVLLASKCHLPRASTASNGSYSSSSKWQTRSVQGNQTRPSGVFETLARFPLSFLGVQFVSLDVSGLPVVKVTPPTVTSGPQLCSSSSGVSSAASTEEEMEAGSENGSSGCGTTPGDEIISPCGGINLWWPPGNQCLLGGSLGETKSGAAWRAALTSTLEQVQSCFVNQVLRVKVLNEITPEKCVHKYLALGPSITARELKDKALSALNIGPNQTTDAELLASFVDPIRGSLEIPLNDDDRPFLLALYLTTLSSVARTDETMDYFAYDQADRNITPRSLSFPISPDRIPVSFIIRDINHSSGSTSTTYAANAVTQPRHSVGDCPDIFEPIRVLIDRPKSILYPSEVAAAGRMHRTQHLRGISQSSYNLSAATASATAVASSSATPGNKGRSRSRLRLHFSKSNLFDIGGGSGSNNEEVEKQEFGIFGRLPKEAWPDCRVSMSVMSLFVVIFYKGSRTEGIFRKSVQMSQLQAMIQRVDNDEDPLSADECTPMCAANILKKYFSEIPGHLLIDERWNEWCKMTTLKTDEEIASYAKKMVRDLPEINQSLLTFLLFTLAQIRANQTFNKMSTDALSTVWGPNLLERPNAAPSVEDSTTCAAIVAGLIGPFTDICCLRSAEFRQKLSAFFDEIWSQMVPEGEKEPPEGVSILELPEAKSGVSSPIGANASNSRLPETPKAKDKRSSWAVHTSSSIDESTHLRRCVKPELKPSMSHEGSYLPPPVPPRNRRKCSSCSPLSPSSQPAVATTVSTVSTSTATGNDLPPPLPTRSFHSPVETISREIRKKHSASNVLGQKDSVSLSGITTVVDRRRSFSRRRHPSQSPIRSCTIDLVSRSPYMIGDICEDYDSLAMTTVAESPKVTLQRSTSDVDAHIQEKQFIIRSRIADITEKGGVFYPWNTVAAFRTSSRNHRCETRWTCGLYENANSKVVPTEKPSGVRLRPTAIYLEDKNLIFFPSTPKTPTSPAPEVPPGICRRISSIYEQKKVQNEAGASTSTNWRNLPQRSSFPTSEALNAVGGGTHLSRGSSLASTGSSTSTTLGAN